MENKCLARHNQPTDNAEEPSRHFVINNVSVKHIIL